MDRLLDPGFIGVMIPIVGIVAVFGSLIIRRLVKHRERMAMIEQGMHPDKLELEEGDLERRDPELIER